MRFRLKLRERGITKQSCSRCGLSITSLPLSGLQSLKQGRLKMLDMCTISSWETSTPDPRQHQRSGLSSLSMRLLGKFQFLSVCEDILDYIWNYLKPEHLGTPVKEIFLIESFEVGSYTLNSDSFEIESSTLDLGHAYKGPGGRKPLLFACPPLSLSRSFLHWH